MAVDKLIEEIRKLSRKQKTELFYKLGIQFYQDLEESEQVLSRNTGTRGKDLLKFAGSIDKKELDIMQQAIENECGRIDYDEW